MKNEEQQLTDSELTAQFILSLKPHSSYISVPDLPIPTQNGVLVMHLPKPKIVKSLIDLTDGGTTELYEAIGNNTQDTCEGIIMAIGPNCSKYMRIGLKCQYSTKADVKFRHKAKDYIAMDEYSILFIVPDETTTVDLGVKDPRQVRREKKVPEQQGIINRLHGRDMNEKDKEKDKTKGKIRPVSTKLK